MANSETVGNIVRDKGFYEAAFYARLAGKHSQFLFTVSSLTSDPVCPVSAEPTHSLTETGRLFIEPIKLLYEWGEKNNAGGG